MSFNRFLVIFLLSFLSLNAYSQAIYTQPLLNKITYQITAEKWAVTNTAKATISVDATLDKLGLSTAHTQILQKLQKLAQADWHITVFNRSQDKSGLEQLHVEAEARLPEKDLAAIREQAKKISKPGETYDVVNIEFTPSNAEMEQTHADVRAVIYNNVKQEVARLNQTYPDLHYFVYSIDFIDTQQPSPTPVAKVATLARFQENVNFAVSSKITETAIVTIGARTPGTSKTTL